MPTGQATIFAKLYKVDEAKREVWGIMTEERVDCDNEIMDYASSMPLFQQWSSDQEKATGGLSKGPVREMHQLSAVGKLIAINFDDANKRIDVGAKIVDDSAWRKCEEGVLNSFSIGGRYIRTWQDPDNPKATRYTVQPSEVSVVDLACLSTCTFSMLKADGTTEIRKFAPRAQEGELMKDFLQTLAEHCDNVSGGFGRIAALYSSTATNENTSPADSKVAKALAEHHESMRKSHANMAQACRKAAAAASEKSETADLRKTFFDQYVYGTGTDDIGI